MALERAAGARRVPRLLRALDEAKRAFAAERYDEARRALKPAVDEAGSVPEVLELYGLSLYRLGRWADAARELEEFRRVAGTPEQDPVLADCYRALGRHRDVEELWEELREWSPSAELVVEGRIVAAGSLADRGDLRGAIALLEKGWQRPARPREHHLRRAYALADLYERAGTPVPARELFRWVAGHDAEFADAGARAVALR